MTAEEILKQLEDEISDHPMVNLEIVDHLIEGDTQLARDIGGDEATISGWLVLVRQAMAALTK